MTGKLGRGEDGLPLSRDAAACGRGDQAALGHHHSDRRVQSTLNGPAKKVVGTEWHEVELLVSLGIDPIGVADVKGYKTWNTAVPLKNEPKDIGTRGEPSMDTIAALKPDLIIASTDLPPTAVKQLRKVAPVVEVESADAADPIGQMNKNLDLLAQATGTTDRAAEVKRTFEAKVEEGRKTLAGAGLGGAKVLRRRLPRL